MPDAVDRDLLARHAAGDATAFPELYGKYYPRVFGYCARLLGRKDAVGDIVQNVFTRAFETVQGLESPELFSYWLFTIARNEVYATFRGRNAGERCRWMKTCGTRRRHSSRRFNARPSRWWKMGSTI